MFFFHIAHISWKKSCHKAAILGGFPFLFSSFWLRVMDEQGKWVCSAYMETNSKFSAFTMQGIFMIFVCQRSYSKQFVRKLCGTVAEKAKTELALFSAVLNPGCSREQGVALSIS